MPKTRSGHFDQNRYVQQYLHQFRAAKSLTFNKKNPDDMAMLEWIDSQPEGVNKYLQRLIREDMARK